MAYTNKTTAELEKELKQIEKQLEQLLAKKQSITYDIHLLRSKRNNIKDTLYARNKSKYNGEYYINSPFRKRFGKTFTALSKEEKRIYYKEAKRKYIQKLKSAETNTNKSD